MANPPGPHQDGLRHRFLMVLGALALFFYPGVFLNDEVSQVAGLTHLAQGHMWTSSDLPEGYGPFNEGLFRHNALPRDPDVQIRTVGSFPLNALGLVVLLPLRLLALAVGPQGAILMVTTGLVAASSKVAATRMNLRWASRMPWLAGGILMMGWPWLPRLPSSPYLELASLQLVSMAATAMAAVLVQRIIEERFGLKAGWVAVALILASPTLFWASNAKYHALAVLAVATVAYLQRTGPTERSSRQTAAAFAVTGLAMWNHFPSGVILLGALVMAHIGWLRAGWAAFGRHAGIALVSFILSIVPLLVHQQWQATHLGGSGGYTPSPQDVAADPNILVRFVDRALSSGYLAGSVFDDPVAALEAAGQVLFWTNWLDVHGVAMSWLSVAPWMVLSLATILGWRTWPALGGQMLVFCTAYTTILLLVSGQRMLDVGGGFDVRYALTLVVPFAVLAAPWVEATRQAMGTNTLALGAGLAVLIVLAFVVAIVGALGSAGIEFTPQHARFDQVAIHRYGGVAIGGMLVIALGARAAGKSANWPHVLTAVALAWAASVQLLLQLFAAHSEIGLGTFTVWFVEVLRVWVRWMLVQ